MPKFETIVVVGTSLAGLRAIETLRREGHEGRIVAALGLILTGLVVATRSAPGRAD
jgi:hypothetical protein